MAHDQPWTIGPFSAAKYKPFGGHGVFLFFAISGLLITTRILEEEAALGRFRLKAFYIRRLFRIQPAALAYLAVIAVFMLCGLVQKSLHYWTGAFLLYANFLVHPSDLSGKAAFTAHFWTLSIEEHFYILLSLILFFFRRHRIKLFAVLIAAIWVAQQIGRHEGLYSRDVSSYRTYWVILYLLVPSMLALLLRRSNIRSACERFLHPWVAYLGTILLMLAQRYYDGMRPIWSLTSLLYYNANYLFFGFSFWLAATTLHPRSLSTRFLELPPMKFLGRLSYSIYLWHIIFFVPSFREIYVPSASLHLLASRPWKYIATFVCALLSYYFIEKPLIRMGHRLAPPISPGHKDLETGAKT